MPEGTVTFYNVDRGFGFVESEGSSRFFHVSNLVDGLTGLNPGDAVSFEAAPNPRGGEDVATEVRLLAPGPHAPVRLRGVVVSFDATLGYGMVYSADADEEFFVHWKQVAVPEGGRVALEEGEELEFELGVPEGEHRRQAVNVRRLDPRPPLLRFGALPPAEEWLAELAGKAEPENWDENGPQGTRRNEVLRSYVMQTFARLAKEDKAAPGRKVALGERWPTGPRPYARQS